MAAAAIPANAQEDGPTIEERQQQIAAQVRDMGDLLGQEGMFPALELFDGRLAEGATTRIVLSLDADRDWEIVGVCDGGCGNLDLVLYGRDGDMLVEDRLDDDIPLLTVSTRAPGSFDLEIVMTSCETDSCLWAVQPFSKRRGAPTSAASPEKKPTP